MMRMLKVVYTAHEPRIDHSRFSCILNILSKSFKTLFLRVLIFESF